MFTPGPDASGEYEVEDILDVRTYQEKQEFWVHWKGYSIFESTWEPEEHLANAPDIVQAFLT